MSIDAIVTAAQVEGAGYALARMQSRATIMRKTGDTTTDADGYEVPEWVAVHIDLPFRTGAGSSGDGGSRGVTIGGVTFEDATAIGHMPATTADLEDDDIIEVVSGEWTGDVFRIVAAVRYDQKTARRVPIVEEVRPKESGRLARAAEAALTLGPALVPIGAAEAASRLSGDLGRSASKDSYGESLASANESLRRANCVLEQSKARLASVQARLDNAEMGRIVTALQKQGVSGKILGALLAHVPMDDLRRIVD
jgi:hypothetical protein